MRRVENVRALLGRLFAGLLILVQAGCATVQTLDISNNVKSCLQAQLDYDGGLALGIEKIRWKDRLTLPGFEQMAQMPGAQRAQLEKALTKTPVDRFLVFDVYLRNQSARPLTLEARRPPVFSLLDSRGAIYNAVGQTGGDMEDFTAKIMIGGNLGVNPNRSLAGTTVFDVPASGTYQLVVSQGRFAGGWSVAAGRELMRCNVSQ